MEIKVTREHFNEVCTIGSLTIDGDDLHLYTLEDTDRRLSQTDDLGAIKQMKVFGSTAIPYGRYEVAMTYSDRFKQVMPLLLNVKGFDGIRVHAGNTAADTLGCVLVAYQKDILNNRILQSRGAIAELYMLISEAIKKEKVFITISKMETVA
ncbi:hypothetical protein UFOVP1605_35 [uncultured Caudovirales phage]|uniref:DUF5675 domain-containing protein n=1 Tax=uncultured Caudovirales phage TaxID=2100421 RepID=A0A6J5ST11_9CAUD|nr:hypothetical protein UFOVP1605_35 [uncultured Caudovirales phage]